VKEVLLSPIANEKHKEEASEILLKILLEMKQVTAVDYIHCSFPSIDSEAPDLTLTRW